MASGIKGLSHEELTKEQLTAQLENEQAQIERLTTENKNLNERISTYMQYEVVKKTRGKCDIVNDPKSLKQIASKFDDIFENEWKKAFSSLETYFDDEVEIIMVLKEILESCSVICSNFQTKYRLHHLKCLLDTCRDIKGHEIQWLQRHIELQISETHPGKVATRNNQPFPEDHETMEKPRLEEGNSSNPKQPSQKGPITKCNGTSFQTEGADVCEGKKTQHYTRGDPKGDQKNQQKMNKENTGIKNEADTKECSNECQGDKTMTTITDEIEQTQKEIKETKDEGSNIIQKDSDQGEPSTSSKEASAMPAGTGDTEQDLEVPPSSDRKKDTDPNMKEGNGSIKKENDQAVDLNSGKQTSTMTEGSGNTEHQMEQTPPSDPAEREKGMKMEKNPDIYQNSNVKAYIDACLKSCWEASCCQPQLELKFAIEDKSYAKFKSKFRYKDYILDPPLSKRNIKYDERILVVWPAVIYIDEIGNEIAIETSSAFAIENGIGYNANTV